MIDKLLRNSPGFHLFLGILWSITAVVRFIENGFTFGAATILVLIAAIIFYILAIIVFVKNKKRN